MAKVTGEDLSKIATVRIAGASDFVSYTPADDEECRVSDPLDEYQGPYPNMIWVTGAGNISVMTMRGRIQLLTGVPAGQWIACPCQQIRVDGGATTATGIIIGISAVG